MNTLEKRDYIHSHLHQMDEKSIDELFEKLRSIDNVEESEIGYDVKTRQLIDKTEFQKEIKERDADVEAGKYVTQDQLKNEIKKW